MKKFLKISIWGILIGTIAVGTSSATIYYIAANGNDNNNGTSQTTPWQSIAKVNAMMNSFNAGDEILFRRGDKFYGQVNVTKSGSAGNEIIFGSYGAGNLPIISGKKLLTGWTLHSGNIYKTTLTDSAANLYINEKIMTIARFPNSGFMKINSGNGNSGFYDSDLQQSSGYWVGANCRVRTVNWAYETKIVSAFSGGSVTFSTATQYPLAANYGFYFDNKFTLLDAEKEWFQDNATSQLYFYAPGGVNPNSITVEAVTLKYGINLNSGVAYVKVQDLKISGYKEVGVYGFSSGNITVQRCAIEQTRRTAIEFNGSGYVIDNNFMEDNLNTAVSGIMTNTQIKNNFINRTALIAGYGGSVNGYYGMVLYNSSGITIENNVIDSTGYTAINGMNNFVIKNNIISYSVLTLNDGGGIYLGTSDGLQISNNMISNSIGNTESSSNPALYAYGIYFNDAIVKNSVIENNTLHSNRNIGLIIDIKSTSTNNKIINNTIYNNFYSQILFTDYSSTVYVPAYNTIVKGNTLYGLQSSQTCMEHVMHHFSGPTDYGLFDSNYYCNPYTDFTIKRIKFVPSYSSTVYSLQNWKTNFSEDLNSKESKFKFEQYGVTDTIGSNMIINSSLDSGIANWTTWPSPGSNLGHVFNPMLDSGSMRIRWNGVGFTENFTFSNTFPVVKDDYYLADISYAANHTGTFSIFGEPGFFPNTYLVYENYRKNYSFVFKSALTHLNAKFMIRMVFPDSLVFVDNIRVYKVSIEKLDSLQMSKLFFNESSVAQIIPLNGITYKDLDSNIVTGSILLQPYSSKILINDNNIAVQKQLNLTSLIQGFYNASSGIAVPDTARVYLRSSFAPYMIVDSSKTFLSSAGAGTYAFTRVIPGINYYIHFHHRNSIETWSSGTINFTGNQVSYDFTLSASMAYGNNLILKGTKYCIFSGDVNQDGVIDGADLSIANNNAANYTLGYQSSDINGDNTTDASDILVIDNNANDMVEKITP